MPLNRFILVLSGVLITAGISVWLGVVLLPEVQISSDNWMILVPISLSVYVAWRVVSLFRANKTKPHRDKDD